MTNDNNNTLSENFNIKDNMCEVCGAQATAGILDDEQYIQTRVRYTCQDHYIQVYERIKKGE